MDFMERHFFVALQLPAEVKRKLNQLCHEIKKNHSFKTWVHPEDYHITLAFLGKASRIQIENLTSSLRETVAEHDIFTLVINRLGFFGNKEQPRIFWAGVEEQDKLYYLQKLVANACAEADFKLEKRPYAPHITLARKYIGSDAVPVDSAGWWQTYGEEVEFQAENIVLYETHFEMQPKYQIVKSFPLKK